MQLPPIHSLSIRAGYPNSLTRYTRLHTRRGPHGTEAFRGYQPPRVAYLGEEGPAEVAVRAVDIYHLNHPDRDHAHRHLGLILRARQGCVECTSILDQATAPAVDANEDFVSSAELADDEYVITSLSEREADKEAVSHKGSVLLALTRCGHPVPDFALLTSRGFALPRSERLAHLERALTDLEYMTGRELGSASRPLIFAMRFAMPEYIPGLMPTYLNVGVTQDSFGALVDIYGLEPATRMYLNNLRNLLAVVDPRPPGSKLHANPGAQAQREELIALHEAALSRRHADLLTDARRQAELLVRQAEVFFQDNAELIFTFTKGRDHRPSLILQQMICTVRGPASYPGVLYSRHPRSGRGLMMESRNNIFGEEIMTGTVAPEVTEFAGADEVQGAFPAVAHFLPALALLEGRMRSSVTVEFAAESVRHGDFFALLQVNGSELTGRATLVSAVDLHDEGLIPPQRVSELVKPWHLRQISSDSIHDSSWTELEPFASGFSVLPQTAASARVYFDAPSAMDAKRRGERVCFCKHTFVPSDTVVMNEVDIIVGLTPAAIHVVTACRGMGIPAFLDLENHGVRIEDQAMLNAEGVRIGQGEWITVSSKRRMLYKGRARFKPARFERWRAGEPLELEPAERVVFEELGVAWDAYRKLVHGLDVEQIESLASLIKVIRTDLSGQPDKANRIVNAWYDAHTGYYVRELLSSQMGTHQENSSVYRNLTDDRKVDLLTRVRGVCAREERSGLTAGSFMIGRFICTPHPISFWEHLGDGVVAFVLDEWVRFEKYMQVLHDVGRRRTHRARQLIMDQRMGSLQLEPRQLDAFLSLKLSGRDLLRVRRYLVPGRDPDTEVLLELLGQPWSAFFDFDNRWSLRRLEKLCEEEGVELPGPEDR